MRSATVRRRAQVLAAITSSLVGPAMLATSASAADSCSNAAVRAQQDVGRLPLCRAYELVSPDLNHASLGSQPAAISSPDGSTLGYQTIDAPNDANSASPFNWIRATRGDSGWSGKSFSPAITAPTTSLNSAITFAASPDLTKTFELSDQPLTGGGEPAGGNFFVGNPTQGYDRVSAVGNPFDTGLHAYYQPLFNWGTPSFSHVFYQSAYPQLPSEDPLGPFGYNTYEWSKEGGVQLLADAGLAPNGAALATPDLSTASLYLLPPATADASSVTFFAESPWFPSGRLYLRKNGSAPVVLDDLNQRTIDPDTNPQQTPRAYGITPDGKTVLFTSKSQLTNDANTGEDGSGNATDAGSDLYAYDTDSKQLSDLTVSTDPADSATGANVKQVAGISQDGSYIYFIATGNLAPGGQSGQPSLYVWHDDEIKFLARADGIQSWPTTLYGQPGLVVSPDGASFSFGSTASLTGYDNTDPKTGTPHVEVFAGTVGQGIYCASCRADGSAPTGDSTVPSYSGLPPGAPLRSVSANGRSVFFNSTDVVVPQASSGKTQVFEYTNGQVSAISKPDGATPAQFLDASVSGDDVFFMTYEELVDNPNGGDMAVYDARVNGGSLIPADTRCRATACPPPGSPAPALPVAGSVTFLGDGNLDESADDDTPKSTGKVKASKVKTVRGTAATVKVKVPAKGRVTISGSSVKTTRSTASKARTLSIRVRLTSKAVRSLNRHGTFKTRVKVSFAPSSGKSSSTTLSLTFKKAASTRKGK
jgi:hypothetical protein